jgi:hypothetical protein
VFTQTVSAHVHQKQGCPNCGRDKQNVTSKGMRLTTEQFTEKANNTHDYKYDYSKTVYVNAKTPIIIICNEHGEFTQRPTDHLHRKTGCPICSALYKTKGSGIGTYTEKLFEDNPQLKELPGVLYFLEMNGNNEKFLKVGITKRTIRERLWNAPGYKSNVIVEKHLPLYECFKLEQNIISNNSQYKFFTNNKGFVGRTELFKVSAKNELLQYITKLEDNKWYRYDTLS